MKKLQNLLLGACGYTVLILTLFYIFAAISQFTDPRIGFSRFATLFGFGCLISLGGFILGIEKLKKPLRVLIHYTLLLISFCVVFIASGNIASKGPAAVFSSVVIFSFFYAFIFVFTYLIRRAVNEADKRIDKKVGSKKKNTNKTPYKPIYGSDKNNENTKI